VGAEPRRDPARARDGAELGELGVVVEAVAGLRLERRRAGPPHPFHVLGKAGCELVLTRRARRTDGGQDPAAARVQFLVRRASGTERELLDPVACEAGVRVAVDEARDRRQSASVELLDVTRDGPEIAHAPHGGDTAFLAHHV
jgi:hypothetical protein